jgi:hypothetical protein
MQSRPSANARTASAMVRLCDCGFACQGDLWFAYHLIEHPDHRERVLMLLLYSLDKPLLR